MRNAIALVALAALLCGCQTTLDPSGPYAGDVVLYQADQSISLAHAICQQFVRWEYDNRQTLLTADPQIKACADKIRIGAPKWFATALALRDAYAENPNPATRDALQQAVLVLRVATQEATKYLAASNKL